MKEKPYDKVSIGERIRKARELNEFTQERVAKIIDVNTSHISDIERGATGTSISTIIALCNALDVTSDYILFGKDASHSSNIDKLFSPLAPNEKLFVEDCLLAFNKRIKGNRE